MRRPAHCLRLPRPLLLISPLVLPLLCSSEKVEHHEWFKDFSHFCHLLAPLLSPSLLVLEVGCGNSRLGEDFLREGVAGGITCIDLSPVAVQRMRDRLAEQGTSGDLGSSQSSRPKSKRTQDQDDKNTEHATQEEPTPTRPTRRDTTSPSSSPARWLRRRRTTRRTRTWRPSSPASSRNPARSRPSSRSRSRWRP